MIKRYDHANEERYDGAIAVLDKAGDTSRAEVEAEGVTGRTRDRTPLPPLNRPTYTPPY